MSATYIKLLPRELYLELDKYIFFNSIILEIDEYLYEDFEDVPKEEKSELEDFFSNMKILIFTIKIYCSSGQAFKFNIITQIENLKPFVEKNQFDFYRMVANI